MHKLPDPSSFLTTTIGAAKGDSDSRITPMSSSSCGALFLSVQNLTHAVKTVLALN